MSNAEQDGWSRVRGRLRAEVGDDVYSSWFARMDLEAIEDGTVRLSVPTRFLKSWIQNHYAERVLACWQAEDTKVGRIELIVRSAVIKSALPSKKPEITTAGGESGHRFPSAMGNGRPIMAGDPGVHEALGGSPLDSRLTFESFVVGRSNTLAHAAAKQVAAARRSDPVMFNPLYIHAGVGLGKTHLLQAITWAGNAAGERKVLYLTAEKFMYGFVSALRTQTALAFKEALRGIGVLVIDDLQFLQGKSTQAEFCHTLNALIDAGRQVVIASDRPPVRRARPHHRAARGAQDRGPSRQRHGTGRGNRNPQAAIAGIGAHYPIGKGPVSRANGAFRFLRRLWTPGDMPPGQKRTLAKDALFRHLCSPASHPARAGLPLRLD